MNTQIKPKQVLMLKASAVLDQKIVQLFKFANGIHDRQHELLTEIDLRRLSSTAGRQQRTHFVPTRVVGKAQLIQYVNDKIKTIIRLGVPTKDQQLDMRPRPQMLTWSLRTSPKLLRRLQ